MNSLKLTKRHYWKLIFIILLFPILSYAQFTETIIIKECLVLNVPRSKFGPMFDPIQQQIIDDTWIAPKSSDKIAFTDTTLIWESLKAGEKDWFKDKKLRRSYCYVAYDSPQEELMILEGGGHDMVYVNGDPRIGSPYHSKDDYESWEPPFNYSWLPVKLRKGSNDLLFKCNRGYLKVKLHKPQQQVFFNNRDLTLPDLIVGEKSDSWGAIVVVNGTDHYLKDLMISSKDGWVDRQKISSIQSMTVRKIGFRISGLAPKKKGSITIKLQLTSGKTQLTEESITLKVREPTDTHKRTFISAIDGSVQYYAVNSACSNDNELKALFLSLHGAGVEAFNQAASYSPKTWGYIVASTNRRPYGFGWSDWGRLDALEAYDHVMKTLPIDRHRVYLTGHSMGGFGSWHLGALFPDRFAAIGPSAGRLVTWDMKQQDPMAQMLMRTNLPRNASYFANNYKQQGVYVLHGKADDIVPYEEAQKAIEQLKKINHKDFMYHGQPDASHWWDVSDENGTDCVDWMPMFDFFARHVIPSKESIREIDFATPNPGISARNHWVCIANQLHSFLPSRVKIRLDPGKRRFVGTTKNVARLGLDLVQMTPGDTFSVQLDSQTVSQIPWPDKGKQVWFELSNGKWQLGRKPLPTEKNPQRYGPFRDAINHHVVFVYGTHGNQDENTWAFNKARFDAESFWSQGNGSIEILADDDFEPKAFPDRNVMLFGNSITNSAWSKLLKDSPVQVDGSSIKIDQKQFTGDNLACLFIRPRMDSNIASIGVVSGTGISGMRTTSNLSYLSYSAPDCVVLSSDVFIKAIAAIKAAGFFGLDWSVEKGEFVWGE